MIRFHTIKSRILALGVALAAVGVIVRQFIALPMMQDNLQDLVASQQLSIASYVARDIDHSISARLALIGQLATELPREYVGKPEQLRTWISERQRLSPQFSSGLVVVGADGNGLLAEYPVVAGRDKLAYSRSDWFLNAARFDRPVMSTPHRGRASGDPIITFAAPVRDANGRLLAVIGGVSLLNAPGFMDRLQETKLGSTGGFLIRP